MCRRRCSRRNSRGVCPVYFGAPNVFEYVNPKSLVFCNISTDIIKEFRAFYPPVVDGRKVRRSNRKFVGFPYEGDEPTDEELLEWSREWLRPYLKPCVDQVKALDVDDEAYNAMLDEPLVTNPDVLTGRTILHGIDEAHQFLITGGN